MSFMALLSASEEETKESTNNDQISKNITSLIDGAKQVLSPEQNTKLRSTLNKEFLMEDISNLYINYTEGNKEEYENQLKKIESKIQQLYTIFDMTYQGKLSESITNLGTNIKADYEIPPKYLHNLLAINARLDKTTHAKF